MEIVAFGALNDLNRGKIVVLLNRTM